MIYSIKTATKHFVPIVQGLRTFEYCINDKMYREGDIIHIQEFDGWDFTGNWVKGQITYVQSGLPGNYCIIGFKEIGRSINV